jgi:hypothetical protein
MLPKESIEIIHNPQTRRFIEYSDVSGVDVMI